MSDAVWQNMVNFWGDIWNWGIEFIKALQSTPGSKVWDALCLFVHYVFNTPIYLLIILIYAWLIDMHKSMKLGSTLLISCGINSALKGFLKCPRPYQYSSSAFDPSTYVPGKSVDYSDSPIFKVAEDGYSTPSGHSQTAGTFWPIFASIFHAKPNATKTERNMLLTGKILLAILVPVAVALSRNYVGVHYPTDTLGGVLLGFVFAVCVILLSKKVSELYYKIPRKSLKILVFALIAVVMNAISMSDTSMAGAFFGFSTGYALLDDGKLFDAKSGNWWQKLLRCLMGLAIIGIIYLGLKKVFPDKTVPVWGQLCRFVRYGLTGFALTYICPRLFVLCKLATPENKE